MFPFSSRLRGLLWLLVVTGWCTGAVHSQTLALANQSQSYATLPSTIATLTGRSELHLTGADDPMIGSVVHLNSPDAWLFLEKIRPATVNSTFLGRVQVNGAAAVSNTNVRVVEYGVGTVVIPHSPAFTPLQVFSGTGFSGRTMALGLHTYYNDTNLAAMKQNIRSFRLKRGYSATFAQNVAGTGISKVYVAQDGDVEISALPDALSGAAGFVRVVPWRWTGKKGWGGAVETKVDPLWSYDWDNATTSTLNAEYVPMRHNANWNTYANINNKTQSSHALGFNEPDKADQANMTVDQVIAAWPNLLASGLRLGAPAPSDAGTGLDWLYAFIDKAKAANLRVDYVPVHFYKGGWSSTQLYNWLKGIHDRTGLPIWVTEFNNGADWTDATNPVTLTGNATVMGQFMDKMNETPFVERYAVFNWVGATRAMVAADGSVTPAGVVYRDKASPIGYVQEIPESPAVAAANYLFEGDVRDSSGNGHLAMHQGLPNFTTGKTGQAVVLNGTGDHVQLSPKIGDSVDFTFGAWVYWTGASQWQRIFDFGNGSGQYMFLSPRSGGNTLRFSIFKTGTAEQQLNTTQLAANQWVHVAVTLSGGTGKLFVNGSLVNTNAAMTLKPSDLGTLTNYLGKSQFAADPMFAGRLDDVRILPHALSDAQVAAMPGSRPKFLNEAILKPAAANSQSYSGSLAGEATSPNAQLLSFAKIGGPAWLSVAADGRLVGVPGVADIGPNVFTVRVSDPSAGAALATLTIPVATPSVLGASYPFEGNTKAGSGNADGVATGAPTYTTGRNGQAIQLDGTDDFVTLPAGVANSGELTLAAWVYWNGGTSTWQRIFDFGTGTTQYFFLTPRSGGSGNRLRFAIKNGGAEQILEAPATMVAGQWVHLAVTLNGSTGNLYVDGALAGSSPITISSLEICPTNNYLGKSQFADPLFSGRIDDFMVFRQVLTAGQILALKEGHAPSFTIDPISLPAATAGEEYPYQSLVGRATHPDAGATLTFSKVSGPDWLSVAPDGRVFGVPTFADAGINRFVVRVTDETLLADDASLSILVPGNSGLIAHYQFDGGTTDNQGGAAGVTPLTPAYVPGWFDQAVSLNGSSDYVQIPSGVVSGLTDITISARVRWDGGNIWQRIFDFGSSTTQFFFLTPYSYSGKLRFGIRTTASAEQILETSPLTIGEWTNVAVTLVGDTGILYVNGVAADSRTITLDPASVVSTNNLIGKSQWAADPLFKGQIDDFRIYNRGLSAAEISSLSNPSPAVMVPDPSFTGWIAGISLPAGESGPQADPDRDGVVNLFEYLLGGDPLVPSVGALPKAKIRGTAELGAPATVGKTYLSCEARVRKNRPGITLIPEAASSLAELGSAAAAAQVAQAGAPVSDGDYETFRWFYTQAVEDSPGGHGFMRLRVREN